MEQVHGCTLKIKLFNAADVAPAREQTLPDSQTLERLGKALSEILASHSDLGLLAKDWH
jgi:hypothetical protein